ncbi:cytochrome c biogenesis protein CcdA [Alicyclobacillus macrosporangiidus]|uniref:cytochrome c biogenesis protein CcdA n=1 Tax=Alicyclobacillus macrosporangiidus TaxID=392015 RepID=UPI0004953B2D|nr:cytochrome c biogenesis protein CcdA [Alicyclobacillus macrosporangiidus]
MGWFVGWAAHDRWLFVGVLLAGLVSVMFAQLLGKAVVWIAEGVGVLFLVLGILMMLGNGGLSFHLGGEWNIKPGTPWSVLLYGVAYALGSLGYTLPLFSVLVLSSFHSQGVAGGLVDFMVYGLGMGLVVTVISLASTLSQQWVSKWVRTGARWMGRLSGVITLETGVYLIIYWLPSIHLGQGV